MAQNYSFPGSLGQAIPPLGPNVGFPGTISRVGERVVTSGQVLPTTTTAINFGDAVVLVNGYWRSAQDYLGAAAANAQNLQTLFAGIAVREVNQQSQYLVLNQATGTLVATTTATASSGATALTVAAATNIQVGQEVSGAGIQPGTTAVSTSGTTINISLPTTAALSTTTVSFTSGIVTVAGQYPAGSLCEVLERGNITVTINPTTGAAVRNGGIYIRTVANAALAGTYVGGMEMAADLATSSITIGTTIGSTTLATSAGTGLVIGQLITSAYFPANTFLVSGVGTNWVTSNAALATVASGAAASFYNTALLGQGGDPWIVFRTGQVDVNNVAEITIKSRHAA